MKTARHYLLTGHEFTAQMGPNDFAHNKPGNLVYFFVSNEKNPSVLVFPGSHKLALSSRYDKRQQAVVEDRRSGDSEIFFGSAGWMWSAGWS